MKHKLILAILSTLFSVVNIYSQDIDLHITEKGEFPKEFDSQYFDHEIVLDFFENLKSKEYDKIYDLTDNILKNQFSKERLTAYFELQESAYGSFNSFSIKSSSKDRDFAKILFNGYFENVVTEIALVYKINIGTPLIVSIVITPEKGAKIAFIDSICAPLIKSLRERDFQELYQHFSSEFKSHYTEKQFTEIMSETFPFDKADNFSMNQNNLWINNKYTGIMVEYIFAYSHDKFRKLLLKLVKDRDAFNIIYIDVSKNDLTE